MKKILKWIIMLLIIGIIIWTGIGIYRENKIKRGRNGVEIQKIFQEETKSEQNTKKEKRNLNLVQKKYKGYEVTANLKIKKLNIDTCVLSEYKKTAMDICVTKFYGPEPNEVGNFCIAGHNYITKNMFGYLYKLKVGDTFILTDNQNGVVEYKIYDIYRAKENETYGLSQKTNGKREVTLITCCNYSNDRLIIKAREN